MSSLLRVLRALAQVLAFAVSVVNMPVHASPDLLIDAGSGKLTGATGVDVSGNLYDVSFQDGSCLGLAIAGCIPGTTFVFGTQAAALTASQALLNSVLIDVGPEQLFDAQPELTRGCEVTLACFIATPYGFNFGFLVAVIATNHAVNANDSLNPSFSAATTTDFTDHPDVTWAIWTPRSPVTPVSEPASLPLLASAGLALIATVRRQQARGGRRIQ